MNPTPECHWKEGDYVNITGWLRSYIFVIESFYWDNWDREPVATLRELHTESHHNYGVHRLRPLPPLILLALQAEDDDS